MKWKKIARVHSRCKAKPKKVKWRSAGRFRCTIHSIDGALYGIFLIRVHTSDVRGKESKEREPHACSGLTGPCSRGRRRAGALGRLELD